MKLQPAKPTGGFDHPEFQSLLRRVYRCLRGRGLSHHDAQDASQEAMLRLWRNARARSAEWDHFKRLAILSAKHAHLNMVRTAGADKRGGNSPHSHLGGDAFANLLSAEAAPDSEVVHAEQLELAMSAIRKVQEDYIDHGQGRLVSVLADIDDSGGRANEVKGAAQLRIKPGTLRTALHRYRRRCQLALLEIQGAEAA